MMRTASRTLLSGWRPGHTGPGDGDATDWSWN